MPINNIWLRMLSEASRKKEEDKDAQRQAEREAEAKELEAEAGANNEENEAEEQEAQETGDEAPPNDEEPEIPPEEGEEPPPEEQGQEEVPQEEDPLGDAGDFSIDPEVPDPDDDSQPPAEGGEGAPPEEGGGEEGAPAEGGAEGGGEGEGGENPDGLPDPDDDGSGDPEGGQEEVPPEDQNIQTTILKLSKLDRQLAKMKSLDLLTSLKSSVNTVLKIIDKNEAVIEPRARESFITKLNAFIGDLNSYIVNKFERESYESSIQAYFTFVKHLNDTVDEIRESTVNKKESKHNNKGS